MKKTLLLSATLVALSLAGYTGDGLYVNDGRDNTERYYTEETAELLEFLWYGSRNTYSTPEIGMNPWPALAIYIKCLGYIAGVGEGSAV